LIGSSIVTATLTVNWKLDFGGERGSARLQEFVCKDVTAEQIILSVGNLGKLVPSIGLYVSWLSGLPNET
jgi:hypothetical protein